MRSGKQSKRGWTSWVHHHESKRRASRAVRRAVRRTLKLSTVVELDATCYPQQVGGYSDDDCATVGARGRAVRLISDHDYWFYYGQDTGVVPGCPAVTALVDLTEADWSMFDYEDAPGIHDSADDDGFDYARDVAYDSIQDQIYDYREAVELYASDSW